MRFSSWFWLIRQPLHDLPSTGFCNELLRVDAEKRQGLSLLVNLSDKLVSITRVELMKLLAGVLNSTRRQTLYGWVDWLKGSGWIYSHDKTPTNGTLYFIKADFIRVELAEMKKAQKLNRAHTTTLDAYENQSEKAVPDNRVIVTADSVKGAVGQPTKGIKPKF